MNLDCSGVTTETSGICVFFLIVYDVSVVLVSLTATFLSINVHMDREIRKFDASVNVSKGATVRLCSILMDDQQRLELLLLPLVVLSRCLR